MIEVPQETFRLMQVQIRNLTDRVFKLEELLSELHPSLSRSIKTMSPRAAAVSPLRPAISSTHQISPLRPAMSPTPSLSAVGVTGETYGSPLARGLQGESSPDPRSTSASSIRRVKSPAAVSSNAPGDARLPPFCPQVGHLLSRTASPGRGPPVQVPQISLQVHPAHSLQSPRQIVPPVCANSMLTPRTSQVAQVAVPAAPMPFSPQMPTGFSTPRAPTLISMAHPHATVDGSIPLRAQTPPVTVTCPNTQVPIAVAGIDTNGDGIPNILYAGADRNRDGIPDALQASVARVPQISAAPQISAPQFSVSKAPSLAAFASAPGMGLVRARSVESSRVKGPPQAQELLSASQADLAVQLQRARESAAEQPTVAAERSCVEPLVVDSKLETPAASSDVDNSELETPTVFHAPSDVDQSELETASASLQIVHVSAPAESPRHKESSGNSSKAAASDEGHLSTGQARGQTEPPTERSTPGRRNTYPKVPSKHDIENAPELVLTLHTETSPNKHNFLRKGSGAGRSRKNAPDKPDENSTSRRASV